MTLEISKEDRETLTGLEEAMWRDETRFDMQGRRLACFVRRDERHALSPPASSAIDWGRRGSNTPWNPARSTGPALFVGGWALQQLWLFWPAPLVGAALAGWLSRAASRGKIRMPLIGG